MDLDKQLTELFGATRSYASYFAIGDRISTKERSTNEVVNTGEALDSVAEFRELVGPLVGILNVNPRGQDFEKMDPPDVEIVTKENGTIGVEVTELVSNDRIRASEKDEDFDYEIGKPEFEGILQERIQKKDKDWKDDFDRSVLLMLCDEPSLSRSVCQDYVKDLEIQIDRFDLVFILFSPRYEEEQCQSLIIKK
ncbi:hypothetical protein [Pelagicoccus sp. SDUM812002]|uniref:hypothetical protein n=1 Tax=Pelagicoccus sp. SDUM812002 TaxID=3041266 RepID=UPI00280FFAB0|nr:hypothetical protein [Pelagicoccus sp. SDUM812002]MDQ8188507.1 hypothetical protein [Pelagicoccus sp. SDUM812002]